MKNTCKKYEEDGTTYQFSAAKLMMQINMKKHIMQQTGRKVTKASIMEKLADEMYVTPEAVKNWMYGHNGPSELEQVKKLGDLLGIDYHRLLEKEGDKMNETKTQVVITDWQAKETKDRARDMYQAMLFFIKRCRMYYFSFKEDLQAGLEACLGNEDLQSRVINANAELNSLCEGLFEMLERNYLDFPKSLTDKISELLWTDYISYPDSIANTDMKSLFRVYYEDDDYESYYRSMHEDLFEEGENFLDAYFERIYLSELLDVFEDYRIG